MHPYPRDVMEKFRDQFLVQRNGQPITIMDFGSMSVSGGTFRDIFNHPTWKYLGVDIEAGPNVDLVLKDPYDWQEIEPGSVDVFISGSTFEHVEFFWLSAMEMERVLKPGGLVCLVAPSAGPEHRHPVDCWRFRSDGMAALAKWAHLEPLHVSTHDPPKTGNAEDDLWRDTVLIARKEA